MPMRKILLGTILSVTVVALGAVIGGGVLAYKATAFAWDEIQEVEKNTGSQASQWVGERLEFFQDLGFRVAGGWLEQNLPSSELGQIKAGLHCFDAIGGPSPQEVLDHVKAGDAAKDLGGQARQTRDATSRTGKFLKRGGCLRRLDSEKLSRPALKVFAKSADKERNSIS